MKREYQQGSHDSVNFFIGIEIEHTPALGMKTLFVVGLQDPEEITQLARDHEVQHIYFGANQSFIVQGVNDQTWHVWETMIQHCLDHDFWCTLDFDASYAKGLHESGLCGNRKFIPLVSLKLPYIELFNYNTTIKIDDTGFCATNHGVWCHHLHDLLDRNKFTNWDQYTKDLILK